MTLLGAVFNKNLLRVGLYHKKMMILNKSLALNVIFNSIEIFLDVLGTLNDDYWSINDDGCKIRPNKVRI